MDVCVCVCLCGALKVDFGYFPSTLSTLVFEAGSLAEPVHQDYEVTRIFLPPPSYCWNCKYVLLNLAFMWGLLEVQARSCLCGKRFAHWPIFPAPRVISKEKPHMFPNKSVYFSFLFFIFSPFFGLMSASEIAAASSLHAFEDFN